LAVEIVPKFWQDEASDGKSLTVGARKLLDILRALPEGAKVRLASADQRLQVAASSCSTSRPYSIAR